jgi:hypothetical protein
MSDPMKNSDRDEEHRRRRDVGTDEEDDPDGREVAAALYGGLTGSDTDPQDDGS